MKKTLLLSLLVAASTIVTARADTITMLSAGPNGGGEILVHDSTDGSYFRTFCLEKLVSSSLGVAYDANASGMTQNSHIPLNQGTAWLFRQFTQGTLPGYDHSPAAQASLQNEIWYLMGLQLPTPDNTYGFDSLAQANGGTGAYNPFTAGPDAVYVVNVYDLGTMNSDGIGIGDHQDLLWTAPVPDGGLTVALLGLGLTGIGAISRRVRK